ncbi:N-acetylmuramic acid 6-phosphate etherase [Aerococcaceae bacterium DSM 111020]|nr:N-acetylmuramic acid 6-phosphate etherase [Aerococcaceae bacterium DSM 111020]
MKKEQSINHLSTEKNNTRTAEIDSESTLGILELINNEDKLVAVQVEKELQAIEKVVNVVVQIIQNGGRVFYVGAGTSGRLGVLDASECPPTYGVPSELFQAIIAGGTEAIFRAKEGVEDNPDRGAHDLKKHHVSTEDIVIGIAASGRTPYVIGALNYANSIGASTASIACVKYSEIGNVADCPIEVETGPEVIAGSTRMKAGTAQKMVLNMISTASMIKLGKVYKNYMVDVKSSNEKLYLRSINMIQDITNITIEQAENLFEESNHSVKHAILMKASNLNFDEVDNLLKKSNGHVLRALKIFKGEE